MLRFKITRADVIIAILSVILAIMLAAVIHGITRNIKEAALTEEYTKTFLQWESDFTAIDPVIQAALSGKQADVLTAQRSFSVLYDEITTARRNNKVPQSYSVVHTHYALFAINYKQGITLLQQNNKAAAQVLFASAEREHYLAVSLFN